MNDETHAETNDEQQEGGVRDALAAVALVVLFAASAIYWVSNQG